MFSRRPRVCLRPDREPRAVERSNHVQRICGAVDGARAGYWQVGESVAPMRRLHDQQRRCCLSTGKPRAIRRVDIRMLWRKQSLPNLLLQKRSPSLAQLLPPVTDKETAGQRSRRESHQVAAVLLVLLVLLVVFVLLVLLVPFVLLGVLITRAIFSLCSLLEIGWPQLS